MSDQMSYHRPVKPADPNADYMTIQETAYIMKVGVSTLRRIFRNDPDGELHSRPGRGIVTSRENRARIHELTRGTPQGRARRSAQRKPATRRSAKSAA
ncbi:DNA-binding protein [Streptomyces sp. SAJ15]|uniref:DNA-binding protein n=1 Tax=Streptomyces sp. SAJ15 TaxID=2011095 RepID=UPI0021B3822A|nr:DNA-binding protein [Streptomyces sp. SAJ15]